MKYNLEINGETTALSVDKHEEHRLTFTRDSRVCQVECRRIDDHHLMLVVDGVQINAFVKGDADTKEILISGVSYRVVDADRQTLAAVSDKTAGELTRDVTPPMPSVVVTVLVEEGQTVCKGDKLVVVSAMKMETTLTAPFDARVARINAAAGDKVMPGDILVDLETRQDDATADDEKR